MCIEKKLDKQMTADLSADEVRALLTKAYSKWLEDLNKSVKTVNDLFYGRDSCQDHDFDLDKFDDLSILIKNLNTVVLEAGWLQRKTTDRLISLKEGYTEYLESMDEGNE